MDILSKSNGVRQSEIRSSTLKIPPNTVQLFLYSLGSRLGSVLVALWTCLQHMGDAKHVVFATDIVKQVDLVSNISS